MPYRESNVSFHSLGLLGEFFGSDGELLRTLWDAFRGILKESNDNFRLLNEGWEQDWFLAKYGAESAGSGTRAWYNPPSDFYSFATFDVELHSIYFEGQPGITVRQTRNEVDLAELFSRTATVFSGPMVLNRFYELKSQIHAHGDPAMAQMNQTLAWFNAGVGRLFGGIVLTPDLELGTACEAMEQRWKKVWAERHPYEQYLNVSELLQWKLDVFYGAEMERDHMVFQSPRQGQPPRWRHFWQWLGEDIEPQRALEAVRLAARLTICPPVLVFLKTKLQGASEGTTAIDRLLALAILRRLTLQLQAMSWLEQALERSFADVRVQDLTSFAFSALRPHWPRRLFALSHRSGDVKAALMKLEAWGNFRYSIDALFAPQWETNVGTVWGLFSAVPGLIRVRSQNYKESVWCRREAEILNYLCEEDDFLRGRRVIELDEAHLPMLDAQIPPPDPRAISLVKAGQFPSSTQVFVVFPFEAWECRLLACAAVTRFIYLQVRDAIQTAVICQMLSQGKVPSAPPLTNHPDGWAPIAQLLTTFQKEWSDDPNLFPMIIDDQQYTEEDIQRDVACVKSLVDLSDGAIDQAAALAAMEWNRTIVPAQMANSGRAGTSFFAVDYRRITPELWHSEEHMVIRGLNRVDTTVPLWILQRADQRVDEWPGMGTNPIFTQYLDKQWDWMWEVLDEAEWPESYRKECKLLFAPKLAERCAETKTRGDGYYQGKWG